MTDDLVKRLRKTTQSGKPTHVSRADRLAAADRIEQLEAECDRWKDRCRYLLGDIENLLSLRDEGIEELKSRLTKMQRSRDRYREAWEEEKARFTKAMEGEKNE